MASKLTLTLGYLDHALNNLTLDCKNAGLQEQKWITVHEI